MDLLPAVMPERVVALVVAVGWALVWFLGQGFLIGLIVAALLRASRSGTADLRYGVACAGLLVMALCPVGTALRSWTAPSSPTGAATPGAGLGTAQAPDRRLGPHVGVARASESAGIPPGAIGRPSSGGGTDAVVPAGLVPASPRWWLWSERIEAVLPAVVAAWLLGVGVMALRLVKGLVEVRGLVRRETLPPPMELQPLIRRLAERSGLRRHVSWLLSLRVEVPTVVGWLRPTVLIPARGMAHLGLGQLEALLAHEIAHVRRNDYLVNVCQVMVEAVLFFHPAMWWVSGRIRVERENCCDDFAVALCGGDRLLVARALFALEERRGTPVLRIAAAGASLKGRVLRLVSPAPDARHPAEAGWAGMGLIAGVFGLMTATWLAGPTQARDEVAPRPAPAAVQGRVLDDAGVAVAGARVRLYRRDSRWERVNPVVEEATTGPDGVFQLRTPLAPRPMSESRGLRRYVLLADRPRMAAGWRTIPLGATTFQGDITVTAPTERTITVVDSEGGPVQGAMVAAYDVGDPASPLPYFRDHLELLPGDGPLTAVVGADGRATFTQLPRTRVAFVATRPGFAATYAFREQDTIRLTSSASLSGRVTGPSGEPLAGVKVVLYTGFMWEFDHAVTDAEGRYRFSDLKARGWDMAAWAPKKEADGTYKLWLDDERFAIPTESLTLEPRTGYTLDLRAMKAGVIRVTLVEQGTNKPVPGARIWGFDAETGSSARFNAYTDEQGRANFYSTPARISLSLAGPPEGVYIEGDLSRDADASKRIDFAGGQEEVTLSMPPIAGTLITISGACTLPDGSPAGGAIVNAGAGRFVTSGVKSMIRNRQVDAEGRFTLEGVPSGHALRLYAETADRKFAGTTTSTTPKKDDPAARADVPLTPTVAVERVIEDDRRRPLGSRKFHLSPKLEDEEFPFLRRTVESDDRGRVRFEGIVPGLSYRIQEDVPPREGPVMVRAGGRLPWYDEVIVLAPVEKR